MRAQKEDHPHDSGEMRVQGPPPEVWPGARLRFRSHGRVKADERPLPQVGAYAGVAQMVREPVVQTGCRGFESRHRLHRDRMNPWSFMRSQRTKQQPVESPCHHRVENRRYLTARAQLPTGVKAGAPRSRPPCAAAIYELHFSAGKSMTHFGNHAFFGTLPGGDTVMTEIRPQPKQEEFLSS